MNKEEIESIYSQKLEVARNNFLQAVKGKTNFKEADEMYRKTLKKIRDEYYKLNSEYYVLQKKKLGNVKKKKSKKENFPVFKVRPADLEIGKIRRFKIWFDLFWFNFRFKMKHAFEKVYTPTSSYYYFKFRNDMKRGFLIFKNLMKKGWLGVRKGIVWSGKFSWERIKKMYEFLGRMLRKIFRIKKKKKKEGEKDKGKEKSEKDKK